jgi:hypothetical protein
MWRELLRENVSQVGTALREPEAFALRWHRDQQPYAIAVWIALAGTAIFGTLTYGMTMGIHSGLPTILTKGVELTIAAGLAWAIPLPALYILNSLTGSRLRASTTLLAALVTTSWGGLALVASIPINWFFSVAAPSLPADLIGASTAHWIVRLVNLLVFLGVGVSMVDVFGRVMKTLEPDMGRYPTWFLILVGAIGAQLAFLFNLFPPA